jgi:hypothetical protein
LLAQAEGGGVVEVRNLASHETAPKEAAWVLIERSGERFDVVGQARGAAIDAAFAPRGLETAEAAIKAAVAWADLLGISVLYVKDGA